MASSIFGKPLGMIGMISEIKKFASNLSPEQAKTKVEEMVSSGQISRGQLDSAMAKAKDIMKFLK